MRFTLGFVLGALTIGCTTTFTTERRSVPQFEPLEVRYCVGDVVPLCTNLSFRGIVIEYTTFRGSTLRKRLLDRDLRSLEEILDYRQFENLPDNERATGTLLSVQWRGVRRTLSVRDVPRAAFPLFQTIDRIGREAFGGSYTEMLSFPYEHQPEGSHLAPTPWCDAVKELRSEEVREVVVSGRLEIVPEHGAIFFSQPCRGEIARVLKAPTLSESDDIALARMLERNGGSAVDVISKGILRRGSKECFELCEPYDFEMIAVLSARARR